MRVSNLLRAIGGFRTLNNCNFREDFANCIWQYGLAFWPKKKPRIDVSTSFSFPFWLLTFSRGLSFTGSLRPLPAGRRCNSVMLSVKKNYKKFQRMSQNTPRPFTLKTAAHGQAIQTVYEHSCDASHGQRRWSAAITLLTNGPLMPPIVK